jgi:peptidoglycan biosynthesis protein MviN/MurJ (putative lipid II flippase)
MGLALGLPARGIGALVARGLPAFKTRRVPLALSAFATALILAFAFLLIAPFGLFGVALATSLGETAFALAGMIIFARWLRADARASARGILKIVLAASAVLLLNLGIAQIFSAPLVQVLIGGVLGALLYVALGYGLQLAEIRILPQLVVNSIARLRARA